MGDKKFRTAIHNRKRRAVAKRRKQRERALKRRKERELKRKNFEQTTRVVEPKPETEPEPEEKQPVRKPIRQPISIQSVHDDQVDQVELSESDEIGPSGITPLIRQNGLRNIMSDNRAKLLGLRNNLADLKDMKNNLLNLAPLLEILDDDLNK